MNAQEYKLTLTTLRHLFDKHEVETGLKLKSIQRLIAKNDAESIKEAHIFIDEWINCIQEGLKRKPSICSVSQSHELRIPDLFKRDVDKWLKKKED